MFLSRAVSLAAGCSQDGLPSQGWVGKASCPPSIARGSREACLALSGQESGRVMPMGTALVRIRNTSPNIHTIHSLNAFELLASSRPN